MNVFRGGNSIATWWLLLRLGFGIWRVLFWLDEILNWDVLRLEVAVCGVAYAATVICVAIDVRSSAFHMHRSLASLAP